ncbi:unnamed protein product [Larinioides sclopetarius]|uniref:Uncharacterized protein n=1 Tax=Larinioides sclopetarius TaxID=280406 RepID=A0AAV2AWI9_9ARAC
MQKVNLRWEAEVDLDALKEKTEAVAVEKNHLTIERQSMISFKHLQHPCYCSTSNPNKHSTIPLHSEKIGVWYAVFNQQIISLFFFTNRATSELYVMELFQPFIVQLMDDEEDYGFFQQSRRKGAYF